MVKPNALVLSLIPVEKCGTVFKADNRWMQDINTQAKHHSITLLCPVVETASDGTISSTSHDINIIPLYKADLRDLVGQADFVQLPGNFGWRDSQAARQLAGLARKAGKSVFVGISSDRAKTSWINRRRSLAGIIKGALKWVDIRTAQFSMARKATGVFVVGHGIVSLGRPNRNIHIGTASWISSNDICTRESSLSGPIQICCASRLEPMKGVSIGVEAVKIVSSAGLDIRFDIVGEGPELHKLQKAVDAAGLKGKTRFLGQLSYPQEFLAYLRKVDFVLLTNLSDEQPRLIFDAISQGCIPVCPRSTPYIRLGLDQRLLYERAHANDAAQTILGLIAADNRERRRIQESLELLARECTLEEMHERRAKWMETIQTRAIASHFDAA